MIIYSNIYRFWYLFNYGCRMVGTKINVFWYCVTFILWFIGIIIQVEIDV